QGSHHHSDAAPRPGPAGPATGLADRRPVAGEGAGETPPVGLGGAPRVGGGSGGGEDPGRTPPGGGVPQGAPRGERALADRRRRPQPVARRAEPLEQRPAAGATVVVDPSCDRGG